MVFCVPYMFALCLSVFCLSLYLLLFLLPRKASSSDDLNEPDAPIFHTTPQPRPLLFSLAFKGVRRKDMKKKCRERKKNPKPLVGKFKGIRISEKRS